MCTSEAVVEDQTEVRILLPSPTENVAEVSCMIKAYILVVSNPGATKAVYTELQKVTGVTECHEVMGPYDIVAELHVEDLADVPPILGEHIRTIDGVESTTSLVTFPDK